MDILSTKGWSREEVAEIIATQEVRWPSLIPQNAEIRRWLASGDNERWLARDHPDIDVDAALASDCRSDRLNCGRCALYAAIWGA